MTEQSRKQAATYLSPEEYQELRVLAASKGLSIAALLRMWIKEAVRQNPPGRFVEADGS